VIGNWRIKTRPCPTTRMACMKSLTRLDPSSQRPCARKRTKSKSKTKVRFRGRGLYQSRVFGPRSPSSIPSWTSKSKSKSKSKPSWASESKSKSKSKPSWASELGVQVQVQVQLENGLRSSKSKSNHKSKSGQCHRIRSTSPSPSPFRLGLRSPQVQPKVRLATRRGTAAQPRPRSVAEKGVVLMDSADL
jgi:hypothetical protein